MSSAQRLQRPASTRSLRLGDTTLTYLPDGMVQLAPTRFFPSAPADFWAEHPEYLDAEGYLVASIGSLLVQRAGRAMLIDAGFGPTGFPAREGSPFGVMHGGELLSSLAAAGLGPADIEVLAITHLHSDHIGWAWHAAPGSDKPPFAAAEYVLADPEWTRRTIAGSLTEEVVATLEPQVRTAVDGEEIFPGVTVLFTPGHTVGHAAFVIAPDGADRVIAFGDALHTPAQVDHPEWSPVVDRDPVQAADVRARMVDELAQPGTIGFGVHFADVGFGRVVRDGAGPAWRPLD